MTAKMNVHLFDADDLPVPLSPSAVQLMDEGHVTLFCHFRQNDAIRGIFIKYDFPGYSANDSAMHRIGFFVCSGHDALDLGGPLSAFNQVAAAAGHTPYDLHVISQSGGPVRGNTGLSIETKPVGRRMFDTVVFVGGDTSAAIARMSPIERTSPLRTNAFSNVKVGS